MVNVLALPTGFGFGSFQITFYALFILVGACLSLLVASIRVKKRGYNPKDIENLFLVAFPMGLIGARVWYCIWQWYEFWPEGTSFWSGLVACFGFVDGKFVGLSGLAIQGGLIFGVLAGIIFLKKRRKHMKVLDIADACAPTILIAQSIGRWGNFFNQEVYGKIGDPTRWSFMGQWFIDQMTINGAFRIPLFLIEGIVNIIGFVILVFVIDKLLRKWTLPGVVLSSYFVWYGLVRVFMEPLRDEQFIMTPDGTISTSRMTAFIFIIVGILLIVLNYINHYILKPRNKDFITLLNKYSIKYDELERWKMILIQAIPLSGWFNSAFYRFSKDNFTAAIFATIFGPVFWIVDLVFIIAFKKMGPWSSGQLVPPHQERKETNNE